MAVAVDRTEGFRADTPRPLFAVAYLGDNTGALGTPNYDIAPDGERFVMVRGGATALGAVILVQNFFEELRQVMPE